jgi:hypothetical protein
MPRRIFEVDGERWSVAPSGRITQYSHDEIGLVFRRVAPAPAEVRFTRFAPAFGAKGREAALAALSDRDVMRLFVHSQPAAMAPETGYRDPAAGAGLR